MKIVIGSDHGGFGLKEEIKTYLLTNGFIVHDVIPQFTNPIPYIEVTKDVCRTVLNDKETLGILLCGTGIGISMAANRHKGIRAGILYDSFTAEYAKRHTNLNILVFGGRTMKLEEAVERIKIFIESKYEGGKYDERNDLLDLMELT